MLIDITVNGEPMSAEIAPATLLIDLLRSRGLTGTKDSCARGECGACTVLIGDRPVLACLTLAARVTDEVTTVEGLADSTTGLREAFADHGALQCGYCTPGQIVTGAALLATADRLGSAHIPPRALDGNICRCTGSQPIRAALEARLEVRRGDR